MPGESSDLHEYNYALSTDSQDRVSTATPPGNLVVGGRNVEHVHNRVVPVQTRQAFHRSERGPDRGQTRIQWPDAVQPLPDGSHAQGLYAMHSACAPSHLPA